MRRSPLVLALTLLLGCGGAEPASQQTPSSPSPSPPPEVTEEPSPEPDQLPGACSDETITGEVEATITTSDNSFSPDCLIVLGGQGLEIVNEGFNRHNLTIEGTDVDLDVEPDEEIRIEAIGGQVEPGTYDFFCSFHRSLGMDGEITITDVG
ncbi:MAG: cupredoxin domain-containing protein [Actinomycetota bacterium]